MKQEVKTAYLLFLLAVVGYFTKYGLNVYLAHYVTPETYGDFSVAVKLLNIWVMLALFGTNIAGVRFLSFYLESDRKESAVDYIAWNMKLIGITFVVTLGVAFLSMGIMGFLHWYGIRRIDQYHLAFYMLWLTPLAAICSLLCSFLLSTNRILLPTILNNILRYFFQWMLFMVAVSVLGQSLTNVSIFSVLFASFLLLSLLSFLVINHDLLHLLYDGFKKIGRLPVTMVQQEWFVTSSRLIGNTIIFSVITILDLLIVEMVGNNEADVGHYAAVITIITLIWVVPMNIYQVLKPKCEHLLHTQSGRLELQSELDKINRVAYLLMGFISFFIIYFATPLLLSFGPTYAQAKSALILLTLASFVTGAARVATVLMVYGGYEQLVLTLSIVELCSMVVLVIPATYFGGITGAAAATGFVMIAKAVWTVIIIRKRLGLRTVWIV